MPVNLGKDKDGCFARWGKQGAKYYYDCGNAIDRLNARKKAIAQGVAIGDIGEYAELSKVSFDYDGVLTTQEGKNLIKKYISQNNIVYIISARESVDEILQTAKELKIAPNRVYATGSNKAKVEKILELNIKKHIDNNPDVIKSLGEIGELFK